MVYSCNYYIVLTLRLTLIILSLRYDCDIFDSTCMGVFGIQRIDVLISNACINISTFGFICYPSLRSLSTSMYWYDNLS